jgi:hypothetical protein
MLGYTKRFSPQVGQLDSALSQETSMSEPGMRVESSTPIGP